MKRRDHRHAELQHLAQTIFKATAHHKPATRPPTCGVK